MTDKQLLAALLAAEDELRELRALRTRVADFIHHTPGNAKARRALAAHTGLPAPAPKEKTS